MRTLRKIFDLEEERERLAQEWKDEAVEFLKSQLDDADDYIVITLADGDVLDVFATESMPHLTLVGALDEAKESVRAARYEEEL